ncbi:solute carrier family 23 protein, partial [Escherichia coli]|uniref:solute carrier family 23 protein n=1 Tax=Escherichia coli TaxID=562 RepID=UPI0025761A7B
MTRRAIGVSERPPLLQTIPLSLQHLFAMFGATVLVPVGNDSNLLIVFYVQIMPDDFVMQLHR